uniref:Ig-like domain-containing protein n=1 Tax=Terrapene triunguis TaxID=2587831 RepID=A0A674J166_9SAUR
MASAFSTPTIKTVAAPQSGSVSAPVLVIISQGDSVRLNCTYQFSVPAYPFWYVQFPSQPPQALPEGWFDATHDKKHKSFHLRKPASELSDSATYYCAERPGHIPPLVSNSGESCPQTCSRRKV